MVSTLSEFGRDGWGEGGAEFAWWCTEAPEAFTGREPVYRSMGEELRKMLGSDALYGQVVAYLEQRARSKPPPAPHPAETPVRFSRRKPASANGRRRT